MFTREVYIFVEFVSERVIMIISLWGRGSLSYYEGHHLIKGRGSLSHYGGGGYLINGKEAISYKGMRSLLTGERSLSCYMGIFI